MRTADAPHPFAGDRTAHEDTAGQAALKDAPARAALAATVPHHVPERAVALYARWWQLESWLRQLAHVKLRALFGAAWQDTVKAAAPGRTQDSSTPT